MIPITQKNLTKLTDLFHEYWERQKDRVSEFMDSGDTAEKEKMRKELELYHKQIEKALNECKSVPLPEKEMVEMQSISRNFASLAKTGKLNV